MVEQEGEGLKVDGVSAPPHSLVELLLSDLTSTMAGQVMPHILAVSSWWAKGVAQCLSTCLAFMKSWFWSLETSSY